MRYEIPKRTMTYADSLEAIGLASLLQDITGKGVQVLDSGDRFVLEAGDLPPLAGWPPLSPGYPFIYVKGDGERPWGQILDYEREREKAEQLREFRRATGKKREALLRALAEQGLPEPPQPSAEYGMAVFLASMRKGWSSDKQLYRWIIEDPSRAAAWTAYHLGVASQKTDDPDVSNSQVFNPISGKGVHRPKPDSTTPGSISDKVIDPFTEWMKIRGAFRAMLPYGQSGNFKVFVVEPGDIKLDQLEFLRYELLKHQLWGGVRLDIEAALRLTELLILHSDVMDRGILLRRRRPAEVVRGLHQAYFQSLGTAAALMNYSFTTLPSWFAINDRDDANAFIAVIREHIGDKQRDGVTGCLRSLDEERSGDIPVLQQYRRWLMTGNLKDFLEFCQRFALHQMERLGRDEWVKAMTTSGLDIIMGRGYHMEEIIGSEGFKSVAHAIRSATIYALSAQKQKQPLRHEVCFGLAQKWKQKIKAGKEEFIAALCDFVQQYNWESENLDLHVAAGSPKHHKVRAQHLDEVIQLINSRPNGAELVGMLLLAYGYARVPKAEGTGVADDNGNGNE